MLLTSIYSGGQQSGRNQSGMDNRNTAPGLNQESIGGGRGNSRNGGGAGGSRNSRRNSGNGGGTTVAAINLSDDEENSTCVRSSCGCR